MNGPVSSLWIARAISDRSKQLLGPGDMARFLKAAEGDVRAYRAIVRHYVDGRNCRSPHVRGPVASPVEARQVDEGGR